MFLVLDSRLPPILSKDSANERNIKIKTLVFNFVFPSAAYLVGYLVGEMCRTPYLQNR